MKHYSKQNYWLHNPRRPNEQIFHPFAWRKTNSTRKRRNWWKMLLRRAGE